MAISDRLTKLTTDITSAYTSIDNKGGTIPSDKNTDNLHTAIDSIEVIETATAEEESLSLANTKAMPYSDYVVEGKSEQETRSGKNLWNNNNVISTTIITPNSNGGFKIQKVGNERISAEYPINIPANTNITISRVLKDYSNGSYIYCQWIATDNTTLWTPNIYTDTLTTSFNKDIKGVIFYLQQIANDGDYVEIEKLQIEKGSTATSYEPYGASPSPEYPSDIHSVADEGTVTIKQRGKNLAYTGWAEDFINRINDNTKAKLETYDNKSCLFYSASAGYGDYDNKYMFKINWKENTQYTIKCSILNTSELVSSNYNMLIYYTDGTYTPVFNSSQQNTWLNFSFTTALNKTIKYITSAYYSGSRYLDLNTFMVYEGTEENSYEPYQGYDKTIQTEPLRSLPNGVKDTIEADGIHRRVGRLLLNGTENWTVNSAWHYTNTNLYILNTSITSKEVLCNYFKYYKLVYSNDINGEVGQVWTNYLAFRIDNTTATDLNTFKTWLSTHNTEVLYPLEEEVIEPFTQQQATTYLDIIKTGSYEDTTNIYTDEDVKPTIGVGYYKKA